MNPAPDADLHSVGQANFDWIVNAVADLAIHKAQTAKPHVPEFHWSAYLGVASQKPDKTPEPSAKKAAPAKAPAKKAAVATPAAKKRSCEKGGEKPAEIRKRPARGDCLRYRIARKQLRSCAVSAYNGRHHAALVHPRH